MTIVQAANKPILSLTYTTLLASIASLFGPSFAMAGDTARVGTELQSSVGNHTIHYRSVSVAGIKIFYRECGDPKKSTLLLLHGFSSSSHMFRDLMPLLADRFHLIAPDYPGFGYSDAPAANLFDPTFVNLTGLMEEFVQAVGLKSFVVYMQDFGGPVGFRMAVRHPEWIDGLIIQNANAYREGIAAEQLKGMESPSQSTSVHVVTPEFIMYLYRSGIRDVAALNPDAWTVDIAALQRPGAKRIQAGLIDDYYTNIALYPEWQAYLKRQQPKTLIVWGKNDRAFLPAAAEAYRRDVPQATLQFFDTGHFALEEDALGIAAAIRQAFSP